MEEIEMEKCACRGSYLDKFIQPALLICLCKGPSHGFQLISDLESSGMVSGDSLDPAGLYRCLKKMEAAGLVFSNWDTDNYAKPRRIYTITEEGRHCLGTWRQTLVEYSRNIDNILNELDGVHE